MKLADGRIVDMNRRAEVFKVGHPLGLQIDVRTGVAQGIIVVRSVDECARMLRKVMLRERRFDILHERGNFLLREKETGSILRVVSALPCPLIPFGRISIARNRWPIRCTVVPGGYCAGLPIASGRRAFTPTGRCPLQAT